MLLKYNAPVFATIGLLLIILCGSGTVTFAVETTGSIQGRVGDSQNNPVVDAEITLLNLDTGYYQTITSREDGRYRARLLPLGNYQVTVMKTGLAVYQQEGIVLTIGQVVTLNVELKPISFEQTITVTADAPIVEINKVDSGSTVNQKSIETLPLNGRNFQDHVLLTPGTVYDNYHVQVSGQRGINNNLMMDGADNNSAFFSEQRGGTRAPFTFSQEAVKEFEVLNNAYSAEFGRAGGGIINAVTKSGSNIYQGTLFYYFRNQDFVEKNALNYDFEEFEQHQFGATLGGPIVKDKLFFFISYDGQLKDQPIFAYVDDYFSREGDENGQSYYNDYPELAETYRFYERFNKDYLQTQDENVLLTKIDWIINSNHHATFRHNYSRFISENGTTAYGIQEYNGYERTYANSFVGSLTSIFTENVFNEFRMQYAAEKRPRLPNDPDTPETRIYGRYQLSFGQKTYLPSDVVENRLQVADSLTWILNDHEVKFGGDINKLGIDNTFLRYGGGSYEFDDISEFPDNPSYYTQAWDRSGNDGKVEMDTYDYAFYVQDNWQPNEKLTINAGLRYDYQQNPDIDMPNPNANIYPWWSNDPNEIYNPTTVMPKDDDNWGPRLAVAWAPIEDGKTVLRAGWGIFYSRTPTLLVATALANNGYRIASMQMGPTHPDFPTYPNRIPNIPEGDLLTPDIFVFEPGFENPMTNRMSVGAEQEITEDFAVGLEYIYARTTHLERKMDINLNLPEWDEEKGRYMFSRVKRNTDFGKIVQFTDDAESRYHGVNLSVTKRFSDNYQFMASYTWSQSFDNDSNENSTELTGYDYPENVFDLSPEWSYSDFDVRHRVVCNGTYDLSDLMKLPEWYSLQLSGIFQYQSGKPWTPEANGDKNRDGYTRNDRPHVYDEASGKWVDLGRNTQRQPAYKNLDLRISNGFKFREIDMEIIMECFNVIDWANWTISSANMEYNESNPPGIDYGKAETPGKPRQYQVGARFKF